MTDIKGRYPPIFAVTKVAAPGFIWRGPGLAVVDECAGVQFSPFRGIAERAIARKHVSKSMTIGRDLQAFPLAWGDGMS